MRKANQPAGKVSVGPDVWGGVSRAAARYYSQASGAATFSCDCAYEWEGICKHCVALGLAVLATYGNSLGQLPAEAAPPGPSAGLPAQVARAWAARPATEHCAFWSWPCAKTRT